MISNNFFFNANKRDSKDSTGPVIKYESTKDNTPQVNLRPNNYVKSPIPNNNRVYNNTTSNNTVNRA